MQPHWQKLRALTLRELEATLAELPAPLQAPARALPVTLEPRPNAEQLRDGLEPDTLGLFVGPDYAQEESAPLSLPPQIILFLDNLWEFAQADEQLFSQEVHTTYLHELGHYLGLDEEGLFERGLE